jgi:hypothetical protein
VLSSCSRSDHRREALSVPWHPSRWRRPTHAGLAANALCPSVSLWASAGRLLDHGAAGRPRVRVPKPRHRAPCGRRRSRRWSATPSMSTTWWRASALLRLRRYISSERVGQTGPVPARARILARSVPHGMLPPPSGSWGGTDADTYAKAIRQNQ